MRTHRSSPSHPGEMVPSPNFVSMPSDPPNRSDNATDGSGVRIPLRHDQGSSDSIPFSERSLCHTRERIRQSCKTSFRMTMLGKLTCGPVSPT